MTDPEGLKLRDSVGFIFNFGSNSKEYAAMKLTLFLSAGAVCGVNGNLADLSFLRIAHLRYRSTQIANGNSGKQYTGDRYLDSRVFLVFASIAPIWPLPFMVPR